MSNKKVSEAKKKVEFILRGDRHSIGGVTADAVGSELSRIYKRDGELTAPVVVDEARPDNAVLHPAFEWNDLKAAEEYRVYQARNIIKQVQIVTENKDGSKSERSVFVHVPSHISGKSAYHTVEAVVEREDWFAAAYQDLVMRVKSAQGAAEALQHAASKSNETDRERLAKIALAVQSLQTAGAVVQALH